MSTQAVHRPLVDLRRFEEAERVLLVSYRTASARKAGVPRAMVRFEGTLRCVYGRPERGIAPNASRIAANSGLTSAYQRGCSQVGQVQVGGAPIDVPGPRGRRSPSTVGRAGS